MASDEGDYDEVTSGLSGERYAVVAREEGLTGTEGLSASDGRPDQGPAGEREEPVQEGHSETKMEHYTATIPHRSWGGRGEIENDNDSYDEDQDELVLERIRSSSPVGTHSAEKPSLIPNESRFNPIEYLIGSLNNALDSLAFDRTLVIQSKMAGELNNSANEVLKIVDEIEFSLKEHTTKYEKLKQEILPEIESNLRRGTKMANKLAAHVKERHPVEYSKGRSKVLDNLTEDEEGLFT